VMTVGAVLFMQDRVTGSVADLLDADLVPFGRLMVLASLFLDGATAHLQDVMSQQHVTHTVESERQRPTAFHLMLYINLWSMLYIFGCMLLSAEQTVASLRFMILYPESRVLLLLFGVSSGVGQVFIFFAIRYCGALLCSMVTTTRKFSTILLSVLLFGHTLSSLQWIASVMVFGSLAFDAALSDRPADTTVVEVVASETKSDR